MIRCLLAPSSSTFPLFFTFFSHNHNWLRALLLLLLLILATPHQPPSAFLPRPPSTLPSRPSSRSSFRSIKALFEADRLSRSAPSSPCSPPPLPHRPRFDPRPLARPPSTKPDPAKCDPRNRRLVRRLFHDLAERQNHINTLTHPKLTKLDPTLNSKTVCQSDDRAPSNPDMVNHYPNSVDDHNAGDHASETVDPSEMDIISEIEPPHHQYDGSYHQYNGKVPQHSRSHPRDFDEPKTYVYTERDENTEHHYSNHPQDSSSNRESTSSDVNSFDQVIEEAAEDLKVYDDITEVDDRQVNNMTEKIPERNQDRLLSGHESEGQTVQGNLQQHRDVHRERHVHEHHEHQHHREERHYQEQRYEAHPETEVLSEETVGPPPSFAFRTHRLSRNVAEAMATIWDRFWADDVKQIVQIIKNRFGQLMPYIRRFLAHLVAFWGGITYIRRALTAFIRVLNKDQRVRELLERVGWASATTLRVFLSMCAMLMSAILQFYHLMRDRVIPDTRRVIPIIYYKAIVRLLHAARESPWSLFFGPFSLTFAIDEQKVPDKYYLHEKLSVPQEDVTFTSFHDIVESVRETVYRTRYMGRTEAMSFSEYMPEEDESDDDNEDEEDDDDDDYGNEEETSGSSTPVHTQSTDETPVPPPSTYSGPKYHRSSRGYGKENRPLTEVTNDDSEWHQ